MISDIQIKVIWAFLSGVFGGLGLGVLLVWGIMLEPSWQMVISGIICVLPIIFIQAFLVAIALFGFENHTQLNKKEVTK